MYETHTNIDRQRMSSESVTHAKIFKIGTIIWQKPSGIDLPWRVTLFCVLFTFVLEYTGRCST